MWRTVKQVLKEYWLAFAIGVVWTAYVGGLQAKLSTYISNFAGSFFLASWAVGQINRIKRDQATKDALVALEAHLAALDISLATLSRWTAGNAKASARTADHQLDATSAPVSEPKAETKSEATNDRTNTAGNVVDFAKSRMQHPPPPPLPLPLAA